MNTLFCRLLVYYGENHVHIIWFFKKKHYIDIKSNNQQFPHMMHVVTQLHIIW